MTGHVILLITVFMPVIAYIVVYFLERRAGATPRRAHRRAFLWLIKNLPVAYGIGVLLVLGDKLAKILIG
jgi:hypothetical protein